MSLHHASGIIWYTCAAAEVCHVENVSCVFHRYYNRLKHRKERGCDWSTLVSFGGQIDREAVARMSGRHWMISLGTFIS